MDIGNYCYGSLLGYTATNETTCDLLKGKYQRLTMLYNGRVCNRKTRVNVKK